MFATPKEANVLKWLSLAVALLTAGPAFAAEPYNWGTETSSYTNGPQYATSKAICRRVGPPKPSPTDQPTATQAKALKNCSAETLYYAPGGQPDYVKARQCAFVGAAHGDDEVFGGSTILMQVYANGLGVPRNLDLATAYACRIDGAPAESDGRVLHIQALKTEPGRLDFCDDITSGLAEGFCQARASDKAAVGRDGQLKRLVDRLSPAARALYPAMKKSFDGFNGAHGDGEVDLSGTGRAAFEIEEQDHVRDQFLKDLDRLISGRWPAAADAKGADDQLNASYKRALAWAGGKDNDTTTKPQDIRKTQRAWLIYRDAFVRFALVAAPALNQDAVLTRLTHLRTAQLDELSG